MLSAIARRLNHTLLYETRTLPLPFGVALLLVLFVVTRRLSGSLTENAMIAGFVLATLIAFAEKVRQHLAKQAVEAGEHLADPDFR